MLLILLLWPLLRRAWLAYLLGGLVTMGYVALTFSYIEGIGFELFHALQAAVIEETGYQAEQFALIHPGGAVGERLNHKVMR